jgi:hypothetical protein
VQAKVVVALVAAVIMLALGATSTRADDAAPAATPASTCFDCCQGDAVCEALAGLADLRGAVDELVPQRGTANSLIAKVDATARSVLDLNVTAALNQLDAFGHEVDALEASGRAFTSVTNVLKTRHDTVKNSISNIH